ncbi:hypothetical protein HJG60_012023 [Phyllostomus discolor]|uniref:Uncharacterized protein n=1 Tax=Phyllostomus discolor TaxID=89673 RepID=A0A833ZEJ3_9CHIR|nr:hypothetical protein HJG60_012023 [Phyllostomus discolor]
MAWISPLPFLVAHPVLLLLGLATLPACLPIGSSGSTIQHLEHTVGPVASGPALFCTGLSKHEGFVSYFSLRNKPAEYPVPEGSTVIHCPVEHFLSVRRQDPPWERAPPDTSKANMAFSCCPVACFCTCKASQEWMTQVNILAASLWPPGPRQSLSFCRGWSASPPVCSNSYRGWPRTESVSWHTLLPQEACHSWYEANRCGCSSG